MGIPRIENCCCCSVRVGTLVLLYLTLFCGISSLFTPTPKADTFYIKDTQGTTTRYYQVAESTRIPSAITSLIVAILGLYGVYKEEHLFLVPALICYVIGLVVIGLIGIISVIALLFAGAIGIALYSLLIFAIIWAIFGYIADVVYSHYCEIKEKKEGRKSSGVV